MKHTDCVKYYGVDSAASKALHQFQTSQIATDIPLIRVQTYLIAVMSLPAVIALKQKRQKSLGRNPI